MKQKRLPGPVGTSCLTCKRRRKKCDQGRPACERCLSGGYDCLGYDHIERRAHALDPEKWADHPETPGNDYTLGTPPPLLSFHNESNATPYSSVQSPVGLTLPLETSVHGFITPAPDYTLDTCGHGMGPNSFIDILAGQPSVSNSPQTSASMYMCEHPGDVVFSSPRHAGSEELEREPEHPSSLMHAHDWNSYTSLVEPHAARNLFPMSVDIRQLVNFVITQYERALETLYFRPRPQQVVKLRNHIIGRVQTSSIDRCAALILSKLLESLLDGTSSNKRAGFSNAIQRFEQRLHSMSVQTAPPGEVKRRLSGFLEAAFMKMRVNINGFDTYRLLHSAAPTFLQIVYSDPSLWLNSQGPPVASLAHILASHHFELGVFALIDMACAMAYGLPQAVDYDTSSPAIHIDVHPVEWIHACPLEFQICLADINRRYANKYMAHDWHLIEQRVLSFKTSVPNGESLESWKVVARLAVIESWRQVLLIYLYLGVCGVTSDDARVRSATRQLFQLFGTVRRQDPPKINVHFVFQYLIAGICARSEKHRAYIRERLLDVHDNEFWILPGAELIPALDHLWHGVAANGQPIKWSDYITSLQTVLPILV